MGLGRDGGRQGQAFHQRYDIDAAGLQHGAVAERDLVQLQFVDALPDGRGRPRQEARPYQRGDLAEAEVDAGGLDWVLVERTRPDDGSCSYSRYHHPVSYIS